MEHTTIRQKHYDTKPKTFRCLQQETNKQTKRASLIYQTDCEKAANTFNSDCYRFAIKQNALTNNKNIRT